MVLGDSLLQKVFVDFYANSDNLFHLMKGQLWTLILVMAGRKFPVWEFKDPVSTVLGTSSIL